MSCMATYRSAIDLIDVKTGDTIEIASSITRQRSDSELAVDRLCSGCLLRRRRWRVLAHRQSSKKTPPERCRLIAASG